jgi:hypothetical protein
MRHEAFFLEGGKVALAWSGRRDVYLLSTAIGGRYLDKHLALGVEQGRLEMQFLEQNSYFNKKVFTCLAYHYYI